MLLAGAVTAPRIVAGTSGEDPPQLQIDCRLLSADTGAGSSGGERGRIGTNIPLSDTMLVAPTQIPILHARPGTACSTSLRIENRRPQPTTFELLPIGMVGSSDPGGPVRFLEVDDPAAEATARDWLRVAEPQVELGVRGYAQVPVTVRIPENAGPGGHYAAIAVRAKDTDASAGELGVQSQIAVPVLVEIAGTAQRQIRLGAVRAPRLVQGREPLELAVRVRNTGNTFATPSGRVTVRSTFGSVIGHLPLRGSRLLLPEGAAPLEARWKRTPWIGRYTLEVVVRPQPDGSAVRERVTVWALPPWWAIAAVVALLALIAVWHRWRAHTDADRWTDLPHDDETFEPHDPPDPDEHRH